MILSPEMGATSVSKDVCGHQKNCSINNTYSEHKQSHPWGVRPGIKQFCMEFDGQISATNSNFRFGKYFISFTVSDQRPKLVAESCSPISNLTPSFVDQAPHNSNENPQHRTGKNLRRGMAYKFPQWSRVSKRMFSWKFIYNLIQHLCLPSSM